MNNLCKFKCLQCGTTFYRYSRKPKLGYTCNRFCSRSCFGQHKREKWHASVETRKRMSLSKIGLNLGEKHPRWRGGRHPRFERIKKDGTRDQYMRVMRYIKHRGRTIGVRQMEHRIIMEQLIGRPLKRGEVVHHINCNPLDNRPQNLMLFESSRKHLDYHGYLRHIKRYKLAHT